MSGRTWLAATQEDYSITVGCIGYPNVGKSSTINKLLSSEVCDKKMFYKEISLY